MTTRTGACPGDAVSETTSKRGAILEAATRVFLSSGYGNTSMDAVARDAGVSKQTVYSHFGTKDALYSSVIRTKCDELLAPVSLPQKGDVEMESTLAGLARRFLSLVLLPENMAHFRAIIAESGRFPQLAEAFYRSGPRLAVDNLSRYLVRLDRLGRLSIPDPDAAARLFFATLRGDLWLRTLLGLRSRPSREEIERTIAEAVRVFLAGYAPPRSR